MRKNLLSIGMLVLMGVLSVAVIGCRQGEGDDVAGRRNVLSDEDKAAITDEVEAVVADVDSNYDVNKITGAYTADDGTGEHDLIMVSAGLTGALADQVYGLWMTPDTHVVLGIIEGKVSKDGKFAGTWKMYGLKGVVAMNFTEVDGMMQFRGTWGGGSWNGVETANSAMTKQEIADWRAQYQNSQEEFDQAEEMETETESN